MPNARAVDSGEALTLSPPPDKRPLNGELDPNVMVFPPPSEYADALVLLLDPDRLNDLDPDELKNSEDAPWAFALLELELDEEPPLPVEPPFPELELDPRPPPPFLLIKGDIISAIVIEPCSVLYAMFLQGRKGDRTL